MTVRIITADVMDGLRQLPDESVHCVVTSPPYWGLRDYGVPGQMGLEPTPQAFVDRLVAVFQDVRRVLRDDGTVWLNLGDAYAGSGRGGNPTEVTSTLGGGQATQRASMVKRSRTHLEIGASARAAAVTNVARRATRGGKHNAVVEARALGQQWVPPPAGLKPKDLMGMPWRVAFALQADGWWLRSDIIWAKPNPMPESVTDRPTKAHEYVFLLSKSERYFYDAEAIREQRVWHEDANGFRGGSYVHDEPGPRQETGNKVINRASAFDEQARPPGTAPHSGMIKQWRKNEASEDRRKAGFNERWDEAEAEAEAEAEGKPLVGRNKRSVWTIATVPFPEAHFATFPPELPETCIKAGCPAGGTVLDPFAGAGTTCLVADRLQRHAIGIELNPEYAEMARRRIAGDAPLFSPFEGTAA